MKKTLSIPLFISVFVGSLWLFYSLQTAPSQQEQEQKSISGKTITPYYPTPDSLATTYDSQDVLSDALHDSIFRLYNARKWKTLENLFKEKSINGKWPPANGGYNTYTVTITKGEVFDRYQTTLDTTQKVNGDPLLTGAFFSPVINGKSFSFGKRALPISKNEAALYYKIEVLKDLSFGGQSATIIPWFGKPGNGIQEHWDIPLDGKYPQSLTKLAQKGDIRITIVDSPNGKYEKYEGMSIP
jgi:hypothetical protein